MSHSLIAVVHSRQGALAEKHLYWNCIINGHGDDLNAKLCMLIDNGSHADFIHKDVVTRLGLRRRSLPRPEIVELAMNAGEKPVTISLSEYVKFSVSDPSFRWKSQTIHAIISPGLCATALLRQASQ